MYNLRYKTNTKKKKKENNFDKEFFLKYYYASERSGIVWDMGCRYYIMKEYNIEIILFDFYEIV